MPKNLKACNDHRSFSKHISSHGGSLSRTSGSHEIWKGPNGFVVLTNHPGDYGKGLRSAIIKAIVAAGLAILLTPCFVLYLFANYPFLFK